MKEGNFTTSVATIQTILTSVGTFVTEAVKWVGSYVTVITENPLILAFVIVAFVGLGVGLIRRLIRL